MGATYPSLATFFVTYSYNNKHTLKKQSSVICTSETLQELISEAVLVLTSDLKIISINHRFMELFPEIPPPQAGHSIQQHFADEYYYPLVEAFVNAAHTDQQFVEIQILSNDGIKHSMELRSIQKEQSIICVLSDTSACNDLKEVLGNKIVKYQKFIEMLPAMVCETDRNGMLQFASDMALRRFGYSKDDLAKGLHLFALLSDIEIPRARTNFEKIQQGEKLPPREYLLKTKYGEQFPALIQIESIIENQQIRGFRGKLEDLSEIKKIENELKRAKEKAEQLSKTKSDFLANFSHEIKTPINAITGLSENLIKHTTNPIQLSQLKTIRKSGQILLSLISDILDLSKIEAGKWELYPEPVDLHELLMDVSETFSYSIEEKGLIYYTNMDEKLPKFLMLDGIKLRQILFNLVGNAVKFTEKGHISVAVEAVKQEGHYDLTIAVEDTGYGIPKSEQRRIFKAFEQGEKMRKKITGTGLGLAITKRIVQMMKGEIRIKSQLFKGSTFIITLPGILAVEYGFTSPTHREARSSKYFPDLNVLIVDDIYTNIETLEAFLLNYNCRIQSVRKVNDVFQALKSESPPNLIFMDIFLPDISGIEACRFIKSMPNLAHIPVVAYSANVHHLSEADKNLFDDFLSKPIKESTLLEILEKYSQHRNPTSLQEGSIAQNMSAMVVQELRQQLTASWKRVNEYCINDDIESFARQLHQIAHSHQNPVLVQYAENLLSQMKAFNISEVESELKKLASVFADA